MTFRSDPDGRRLPVKLDATSNGEYAPIPLEPVHREAKHLALDAATTHARPLRGFTSDPRCEPHRGPGDLDYLRCVGPDQFVKDVFLDSDTDLMVLSFVPSTAEGEPLKGESRSATPTSTS
jgi:hypothetical protein